LGYFIISPIVLKQEMNINMYSSLERVPTILAVDDCPITQKLIAHVLDRNYRVLVASNAREALEAIYKEPIDLLLLDVSMPEIDGLELCRALRQLPQFDRLPIIMLTARNKAFDKVIGKMAGATEYLTKPFQAEQLCQLVGKLLSAGVPVE
jgi:twitching motility two-component system response regulator PilG